VNRPILISAESEALTLVEVLSRVPAGFPSPAQDHTQKRIDLNEVLVLNPVATFLFQVEGDSMTGARIFDGDRLIVDRSIEALHGRIVLACVDDQGTGASPGVQSGVSREFGC
jgi:DNA polymerase V